MPAEGLQCLCTVLWWPRPPCTRPCAMMHVSVCHEGAQKYLEELDVKAVGIKDDKKEAMAKMWNKWALNYLKFNFCHERNRLKIKSKCIWGRRKWRNWRTDKKKIIFLSVNLLTLSWSHDLLSQTKHRLFTCFNNVILFIWDMFPLTSDSALRSPWIRVVSASSLQVWVVAGATLSYSGVTGDIGLFNFKLS